MSYQQQQVVSNEANSSIPRFKMHTLQNILISQQVQSEIRTIQRTITCKKN